MCGIVGWADYARNLSGEHETITAMTRTMAARGPDDEGLWIADQVALGHRRLAVIDVAGGVQPMSVEEDGSTRAVIVYSGETYNFRELRRDLESHGHVFRTSSDTEVVLHAYLEWGDDFPERLNGMFALAIWDTRRRELLLVRDRMGIKPLFYAPTPDGVLFGSEPKAVLAHPGFTARIDDEGIAELLTFAKTPGHGVFHGLHEVRPGHVVHVSESGITQRRYWQLTDEPHTDDLASTVEHVRDLLTDIVNRQLISDVPLCTLLSGGLDSSVLTALAARELAGQGTGPVRSFSVDFDDETGGFVPDEMRDTADGPFAAEVVKYVGSRHSDVTLSSDQLSDPAVTDAVLRARDLPGMGDMDASLYLLFAQIRRHSTVALSGESADEVFGGYQWFHDPAAVSADTFPWSHSAMAIEAPGNLFNEGFLRQINVRGYLADRYHEALAEVPHPRGESPTEFRMREICYLHLTRFVQLLLDRKDRMSMAVGLEVRVPFCDHRLVQYVFGTPWAMKTYDGREKSLLRGAAADLIPESVARRVKSPYPATQNPSYERAVRHRLTEILDAPDAPVRPYVDEEAARAALRRPVGHESLQRDRLALERLIALNDWLVAYRPEHV